MNSKDNHVKFVRFVLFADLYIFTRLKINYQFLLPSWPFFFGLVYDEKIIRFGFCNNQNLTVCSRTISFQTKSNV